MIRFLLSAAIASLICLHGPAIADEVKGSAAVKIQDPKRGSIPDLVWPTAPRPHTPAARRRKAFSATGRFPRSSSRSASIKFKKGDKLLKLDFGASPATSRRL